MKLQVLLKKFPEIDKRGGPITLQVMLLPNVSAVVEALLAKSR